jgi:phenylalanyl-tRNA synthetase beta subunit
MLAYGQPLHVFDRAKIEKEIVIRGLEVMKKSPRSTVKPMKLMKKYC